jgi:hypothetical protein
MPGSKSDPPIYNNFHSYFSWEAGSPKLRFSGKRLRQEVYHSGRNFIVTPKTRSQERSPKFGKELESGRNFCPHHFLSV